MNSRLERFDFELTDRFSKLDKKRRTFGPNRPKFSSDETRNR